MVYIHYEKRCVELTFNPNLYEGGGQIYPPGSCFATVQKRWRQTAETLWLLLLAYYTSFDIHQGAKQLPW